ncbi:tetratricopeptide repeat protein [Idiomarina seosinensis]|uniref:heme biosynthesis HemY N-terminal domain-containing protein n=1 Tax=Idiomarina seosinensis TaxID=281739 RepID=UPI00384D9A5A
MKWLIVVLALMVAGAILGPISSGNAGYVLIQFAGWSFETSVIALAIITVIAVVAVSLIVATINALLRRTRKSGKWLAQRREQRAKQLVKTAQLELLQHNYMDALQCFEKAYKKHSSAGIAAQASYSAQQCNEYGKAEFWRDKAGADYLKTNWILKAKRIESLKSSDTSEAAREMQELLQRDPKDPYIWQLATEVYIKSERWQQLTDIMPSIERYAGFDDKRLAELKHQVMYQRFLEEGRKSDDALFQQWRSLSKSERNTDWIRLSYADALRHFGKKEACAKIIYKGLKRGDLSIEQANSRGLLFANYAKLVEHVQDTLKRNPDHKGYLRALALLAFDNKDYSLAQRAMSKLIDNSDSTEDWVLMGDIYNALGDSQLAANAYQKALA